MPSNFVSKRRKGRLILPSQFELLEH
uniref:Uncharacterized protein n=1 Tax=Anguilla anguilla TaxID=7936 RepID=A0A0E9PKQ6_ANGAN